jgi:hypothetical protein
VYTLQAARQQEDSTKKLAAKCDELEDCRGALADAEAESTEVRAKV